MRRPLLPADLVGLAYRGGDDEEDQLTGVSLPAVTDGRGRATVAIVIGAVGPKRLEVRDVRVPG